MKNKISMNYLYFGYIILSVIAVISSQFFYFDYLKTQAQDSIFFFYFYFLFSALMLLSFNKKLNFLYLLSSVFMFYGWRESYFVNQSGAAFVYYGLSGIIFWAAIVLKKKNEPEPLAVVQRAAENAPGTGFYIFFLFCAIVAVSFNGFMRGFFFNAYVRSLELLHFMPLRSLGICGNDICSAPFTKYYLLLIPLSFIAAAFFVYVQAAKGNIKKLSILLAVLVFLSFFGKISVVSLSTQGMALIGQKIAAPVDCAYYHFAAKIGDPYLFVKDYVEKYQTGGPVQFSHLKGHPPLATLTYWFLIKIFGANPFLIGLIYMLLTSLVVVPVFYITKLFLGTDMGGFSGAFVFLLTPFNLILSSAGIDAVVLLMTAIFTAAYLYSTVKDRFFYFIVTGFIFGINTLFTFGTWPVLLMLPFLYAFIKPVNKTGIIRMVSSFFAVAVGIAMFHLLFQSFTGFKYDYIESFIKAKEIVRDISGRPYILWVWANFVHWSIFFSVPLTALFFYRLYLSAAGKVRLDYYTAGAITLVLMYFLSGMGRAEQNRQWMFLAVILFPQSLMAIYERRLNLLSVNNFRFALFSAAVYLNSVIIEMYITDSQ